MQSTLIIGSKEKTSEKALEIAKTEKISNFDIKRIESEKSIGISDIKSLNQAVFLKPFKGEKKLLIVEAFNGFTIEAQNSFLKTLEEPPFSTIIMILTNSLDFILPTVISRCFVIDLREEKKLDQKDFSKYLSLFEELNKNKISESLKIAQENGKSREEALNFLEALINILHLELKKGNREILQIDVKKSLGDIQKTHTIIKGTNVNVRFALENLFLNL